MQVQPILKGLVAFPVINEHIQARMLVDATREVTMDDVTVRTAPLKPGQQVNLLGISMSRELLDQGVMDVTDELHPRALGFSALYFNVGDVIGQGYDRVELTWDRYVLTEKNEPGARRQSFEGRVDFITEKGLKGSVVLMASVEVQTGTFQFDWVDLQGLPEGSFLAGADVHFERVNYNRRWGGA